MKKCIGLLFGMFLFAASTLFAAVPAGYNLVWSDEFTGTTLDTVHNWSYETGAGGWGNQEWEYYTAGNNLTIGTDVATIAARKETQAGPGGASGAYTSTRMTTANKVMFKYGYLEVSLKGTLGDGLWPAFWTLGASITTVGWPTCGEMELYEGRSGTWSGPATGGTIGDDFFIGTCHFKGASGTSYNSKGKAYTEPLANNFHKYAILWDSAFVEYYFDDVIYWSKSQTPNINAAYNFAAFHNPHYFLANIAIMGNYVAAVTNLGANTLPAQMTIDYVKIYQNAKGTLLLSNPAGVMQPVKKTPMVCGLVNPSSAECKVYDMRGKLVADYTNMVRAMSVGTNPLAKLGSSLPTGTYVVRLKDADKVYSQKLATTR
jgi:beta-glucanase (GH16 family)